MVKREELSKAISHALRHEPWLYELELDDEGWADLDILLAALRERGDEWQEVSRDDVEQMIALSAKHRHEIEEDRIRALYGHSLPGKLRRAPKPQLRARTTSVTVWVGTERRTERA